MIALAESGIPVAPEELDADPLLLCCPNGTLDLRSGELHPHRREDLLTRVVSVPFDPAATAPRWDAFLQRVMAGDAALIGYLQRAAGYSLTGLTGEETLFFLHAEFFEFLPQFKLWLAANHRPRIHGTDTAIWERIQVVPFAVTIPPDERDRHLAEKLQREGAGILRWVVEGCLAWQREHEGAWQAELDSERYQLALRAAMTHPWYEPSRAAPPAVHDNPDHGDVY